jgi:transcriptional antiterminator RfaH
MLKLSLKLKYKYKYKKNYKIISFFYYKLSTFVTRSYFLLKNLLLMKKWFVLYTRPNHELKVAELLKELAISCFCPTVTVLKQYSDRKKKLIKPFLPSYVFVFIEEGNRTDVFSVFGIVRYLFWLGKPAIIRESEIDLMREYLNGIYRSISISSFIRGQFYEISEGVLSGRIGKVIEIQKNKVKLELQSLGMMVVLRLKAA